MQLSEGLRHATAVARSRRAGGMVSPSDFERCGQTTVTMRATLEMKFGRVRNTPRQGDIT